jgi:hypothetical protein
VQEVAAEAAVVARVEVSVGEQERQLVRWPPGKLELALAVVTDDPKTGEAGVDVEARHAHDVVVVPEHRRALVVWIAVKRRLAGSGEVLGPAVARGVRHPAVEVDDRVARERGRCRVRLAAAAAGHALGRHAVDGVLGCDRHDHGQGPG